MGDLDELKEEIEELREEIQDLKESSDSEEENQEEDESRDLYMYIQHVYAEEEILGMEMERRKTLLLEEGNSYSIPNSKEAKYSSTTRQVLEFVKSLGIDCWHNVERVAEKDDAVYYRVRVPESVASEVDRGAWVTTDKATQMADLEAREYL